MQACVSLSNKLKFITICFHGIIHQSFVHVCSIFFEVKENVFQIHAIRTKAVVVSKIVNFTFCWEKDQTQVFSSEFCETSKNNVFIEHLWATASAKGNDD